MIKLKIEYYAIFRDLTGKSDEIIETTANSPEDVYKELSQKYAWDLQKSNFRIAVNEEFSNWDHQLKNDDTVVFIAPVSGG